MHIREYDETKDRAGLRRCVIELQDFERNFDPRKPEGSGIADAYIENLLSKCRRCLGAIFVAEDAGIVVGYTCVLARVRSDDVSDEPREYALVKDLVVLSNYRNRGIGRRLLDASEAYARDHGAACLQIAALAANAVARALYTERGFKEREIILEKPLL